MEIFRPVWDGSAIVALIVGSLIVPGVAAGKPVDAMAGAESIKETSAVSVMAEPQLSDGRLVLKVAFMNRTPQPVQFGPENARLAAPDGKALNWVPLPSLIKDVQVAAGIQVDETPSTELPSTYAAPAMPTTAEGKLDVSGYTGGMGLSQSQQVSRNAEALRPKKRIKPEDLAKAEKQIADLKAGILQPQTVQQNAIASGQLVSEKLKFRRGEDRLLLLRVNVAGEEHEFQFEAPPEG